MFGRTAMREQQRARSVPGRGRVLYDDVSPELAAALMAERARGSSEAEAQLVGQKSRPATIKSDVLVPLFQALITGLIAWLFVWLVLGKDARLALSVGISIFTVVWLVQLVEVRGLIRAAEQVFHVDFDRNRVIGAAVSPPMPDVIVQSRGPKARNARSEPVVLGDGDVHPFQRFLELCAAEGTDERTLADHGYTRRVQVRWRDQLIRSHWAVWKSYDENGAPSVNTGWSLVAPVEEVLASVSFMSNSSSKVKLAFRREG